MFSLSKFLIKCICWFFCLFVYLEDVEGLKLDVGTLVSEQIHHQLQVFCPADVPRHDREVMSVQ